MLPSQHALLFLLSARNSKGVHPHSQSLAFLTDAQSAWLRSSFLDTKVSLLNLTECFDLLHPEIHLGSFTSWRIKTLPVPRLLLDAIQLLHLMLFDPRVLLPASMHREHPLLVLYLRVVTSSLSKVVSRTFFSPPMLKVGAGFLLLVSWSPYVPGRLEPFLTMLPLGSSDSTFSLQSIPSVYMAIARWKYVDTFLPTAASLPIFP